MRPARPDPSRPRWRSFVLYALAGSALHGVLLVAPLAVAGRARRALDDPAVRLFLVLASGFYLTDLPTLPHAPGAAFRRRSAADRRARRWGLVTGVLLLATFWTALLGRPAAGAPRLRWAQVGGALLMLAGVALRGAAVRTLGPAFVTEVEVEPDQPLIEHGIYGWARHPSETGNLAVALGACLLLESRPTLLLVAAVLTITLRRIGWEDHCLADAFGPRFHRYERRVKRLVPWVY